MKQMLKAENINLELDKLPTAKQLKVFAVDDEQNINHTAYKIMEVTENNGKKHYINPNKNYALVQHKEAFRPIVEALVTSGVKDFDFMTYANAKKAELDLYVDGEVNKSEGVRIGINCANSLDGHSTLKYGFELNSFSKSIEVVGYRQVCKNGLKIKVPLNEATIFKLEEVTKLRALISEATRLRHTSGVFNKIELIKYSIEAIAILKKPVEAMINYSKAFKIEHAEVLKKLIKRHVGRRFMAKVRDTYETENTCSSDLWGLYNAITYVASHDESISDTARETLLDKGANMLLAELTASSA